MQIDIESARSRLPEPSVAANRGAVVVITVYGEPMAGLVPLDFEPTSETRSGAEDVPSNTIDTQDTPLRPHSRIFSR